MTKNTKNIIELAVEDALRTHASDTVDIVVNHEADTVDIMYHSRNNSYPIQSNVCKKNELSEQDISEIANKYGIGYVM